VHTLSPLVDELVALLVPLSWLPLLLMVGGCSALDGCHEDGSSVHCLLAQSVAIMLHVVHKCYAEAYLVDSLRDWRMAVSSYEIFYLQRLG
jgi:hypothetical protein